MANMHKKNPAETPGHPTARQNPSKELLKAHPGHEGVRNLAGHSDSNLQFKMQVGGVEAPLEREADAAAEQAINRRPITGISSANTADAIQREGGEPGANPVVNRGTEQKIKGQKGHGSPMKRDVRSEMESSFGRDFGQVRVHTGGTSKQLNQQLNSRAFTTGQDIFFGEGQYDPGSKQGKKLLAHELTHTVQQGPNGNAIQRAVGDIDLPLNQQIVDYSLKGIKQGEPGLDESTLYSNNKLTEAGLKRIFTFWENNRNVPTLKHDYKVKTAKETIESAGGTVTTSGVDFAIEGTLQADPSKGLTDENISDARKLLENAGEGKDQADREVLQRTDYAYAYITTLFLDYYDHLQRADLLSAYYDERLNELDWACDSEELQNQIVQMAESKLSEVEKGEAQGIFVNDKLTGVVHAEAGGKVIHLGMEAFADAETLKKTMEEGLKWTPTKSPIEPVDPKSALSTVGKKGGRLKKVNTGLMEATAQNRETFQDVRSLRIIQHIVGAPESEKWDDRTVAGIAQWKGETKGKGKNKTPLGERGTILEKDLQKLFEVLLAQKDYTSIFVLLQDFYDLYENMGSLQMDENGTLDVDPASYKRKRPEIPETLSPQHAEQMTGINFTSQDELDKDSRKSLKLPGKKVAAQNTQEIDGLPPRIMVGSEVFKDDPKFQDILYLMAHELTHSQQEIEGKPTFKNLREMNAEKMEVSRQFGGVQLPLPSSFMDYVGDYDRALHELANIDLDKNRNEALLGIDILKDIIDQLQLRHQEMFGAPIAAKDLIPSITKNYNETSKTNEVNKKWVSAKQYNNAIYGEFMRVIKRTGAFVAEMKALLEASGMELKDGETFASTNQDQIAKADAQWQVMTSPWESTLPDEYKPSSIKDATKSAIDRYDGDKSAGKSYTEMMKRMNGYLNSLATVEKYHLKWTTADFLMKWKNWLDKKNK